MLYRTAGKIAFIGLLCLLSAGLAQSDTSYAYGSQKKRVAAGVIQFGSVSHNVSDRSVFYIIDQRSDVKPSGWRFFNPLACKADQADASYWDVDISTASFDDIAKFNVLLLRVNSPITFSRTSKEVLRKFVDSGGTLWIDNEGGSLDSTFFIDGLAVANGGSANGLAVPAPNMSAHALLNYPFNLSADDISKLGYNSGDAPNSNLGANYVATSGAATNYFYPVVSATSGASSTPDGNCVLAAAECGSGHIVVTGQSVIGAIVDPVVNKIASGDYFPLRFAQDEDIRVACNIINWGSDYTTVHKGARHSGYSYVESGSMLIPMWTYAGASGSSVIDSTEASPAILDDMVFFVDKSGVLHAIDMSSTRDRDGDGSPDDGIRDQSSGSACDEIWAVKLSDFATGPYSSPTAGYVWYKDPASGSSGKQLCPMVFVAAGDGTIVAFMARQNGAGNWGARVIMGAVQNEIFNPTDSPAPPVLHDGNVYWGDGAGCLHARDFNFVSGNYNDSGSGIGAWWVNPGSTLGKVRVSPTIGWIRDPATGTTDEVLYLADTTYNNAIPGNIRPFSLKVRNEVLAASASGTGAPVIYQTRSAASRIAWANVFVTDKTTGNLVNVKNAAVGGQVTISDNGKITVTLPSNLDDKYVGTALVADYDIDPYPATSGQASTIANRSSIEVRKTSYGTKADITSTPALGPNDILYFTAQTDGGDEIYAVQESGRGVTRSIVKWRWTLPGSKYPNCHFVGSPVVADGMVYCAIAGAGGSQGYILAFEADPVITLDLGQSIQSGSAVSLVQDDTLDPTNQVQRKVVSANSSANFDPSRPVYSPFLVDYDRGRLTFYNLRPSGDMTQDLTNAHDISVQFLPGNSDSSIPITQVHPAYTSQLSSYPNDHWNNLAWSAPLPSAPNSAPVVAGNVLYVGCQDGSLCALDVQRIKQRNPTMQSEVQVDWSKPTDLSFLAKVSSTSVKSAVAAANGMLAVMTDEGLTVLNNPIMLVADANRIAEIDASGSIVWSCDGSLSISQTKDVSTGKEAYGWVTTPFNRPSVARYAPTGGVVVADTGNNRVVQVSRDGVVLWEVKDFRDDDTVTLINNRKPASPILSIGSPLTLDRPTDVTTWMLMEGTHPAYHYLIADSGHNRVVEVVARYNASTGQYENQLEWSSKPADEQGKAYRFTTARMIADLINPNDIQLNIWRRSAVISNATPAMYAGDSGKGSEGSRGSIAFMNGPNYTGVSDLNDQYIGQMPAYPDPGAPLNRYLQALNQGKNDPSTSMPWPFLMNPMFFDRVVLCNTAAHSEYYDLLVDAAGIYVKHVNRDSISGTVPELRAYLAADYAADMQARGISNQKFQPTYAQLLPDGSIFVVNKASVSTPGADSPGEIIKLSWNGVIHKYTLAWRSSDNTSADKTGIKQPSSVEKRIF